MTREEMATALERFNQYRDTGNVVDLAAAELRKRCATCQHWSKPDDDWDEENYPRMLYACAKSTIFTPGNGSGHCHEWDPKP